MIGRLFGRKCQAQRSPSASTRRKKRPIAPTANAQRVTFLGGLHWPPNAAGVQWFVDHVWPLVLTHRPDAILTIIGKQPPAGLANNQPNVEITGYVPTVEPLLAETAAFVVPLHAGGGMRVKIVDAWAWGLPIVSTTIGAEGICYQDGEDLLIADSAESFATAIINLLTDQTLNQTLRTNGRQRVERDYAWRRVYPQWEAIYRA